ncbi:hypothetical protein [Cellulomonas cellasea]|uniref:Uncharacterized protein n=1 Tax=Cellulomonas cellasea TaxID=43670 RepID=A0A7W4UFD4_9CELL|nr:hypothetical protein [Cellulomonas cellasea]MBB2923087.1 hypothetical protein [Cellulomonas cellasea]
MTDNLENPADADPADASALPAVPPAVTPPSVMDLLAEHVPLALLADLAAPDGPVSQAILETEGMPEDAWWEGDDRPATEGGTADGAPAGADEDELPVDPDAAAR